MEALKVGGGLCEHADFCPKVIKRKYTSISLVAKNLNLFTKIFELYLFYYPRLNLWLQYRKTPSM